MEYSSENGIPSNHWESKKKPATIAVAGFLILVEVRGVEPLSESTLTGLSPGAVKFLHSLPVMALNRHHSSVES